ncbi:hypothetical protein Glove_48g40 [Diversispora epigaea]|uniref:Poly [ADP-ribose] polymerase n=1 Tax=Diversispora epigaea TaxID=1348612 RepID=A0A397JE35_9GLOM|nr:hypothetical protein Glove_48g40 [Diversispora epigaea]
MSSIFSDCCFTFSGSFEEGSHKTLGDIVKKHGATTSSNVTVKTTHLVSTEEDYNTKKSSKISTALKRGEKVSIITWKWVEDSISKNKRLPESEYVLVNEENEDKNGDGDEQNNEKDDKDKDEQIEDKNDNKTLPISRKRKLKLDTSSDQDDKIVDNSSIVVASSSKTVVSKKKRKIKANVSSSTIDQSDGNDVKVDVMQVDERKMVTIIKKGKAPVDEMFSMNNSTHVYADDQIVWDCLLNQTNVKGNNNKFYIIQLLESDSNSSYYVFNKWGRVGYPGQTTTSGPFSSLPLAQHEFQKKFRDKTGNSWADVCNDKSKFVSHKNKYTLLERDYGEDMDEDENENVNESSDVPDSQLHPKVQDVVQMIFDINAFKSIMVELNYDASKLPLGKLSKATITQGYQILKRIEAVITNVNSGNLVDLSNEFYTVIPHSFGMRAPPIISTIVMLKEKLDMVEALGEIEIAASLIKSADSKINLVDSNYNSLNLEKMEPLDHNSEEFKLILKYVNNTRGSTHYYKLEVLDVFSIERQGENERFSKYSNLHNRMLLWHGSRRTNFAGILSQGLRIAPPHVPCTGYMFGKGVYFADCVTKSAGYCYSHASDNIGFMLLCEVACGDMLELTNSDYYAEDKVKKEGKHCTKGMGKIVPDPKEYVTLKNGTIVPCGKGKDMNDNSKFLYYNEYIVYDVNQISQKYLLKVKF